MSEWKAEKRDCLNRDFHKINKIDRIENNPVHPENLAEIKVQTMTERKTAEMSEWKKEKTADLIDQGILEINDGYRAKNSELSSTGLPFVRAQNINNGFLFDGTDCFPLEDLKKVGKKISKSGDVVFTSKGTVGRFAFVHDDTPKFVYAPQLCFWRSLDETAVDPRWLYYWMQSAEFYRQYKGVSGQTDMAEYVSLQDQRRMHLTLPPFPIQRRIASILGTFDDKIELNRRMNRTLEQMAQALFKSWFVDFDPVHAKAAGRRPKGLSADIARLFPKEFEDSKLGPIPKGWKAKPIGETVQVVGGGTPSTKNLNFWYNGAHSFCTPKDMSSLFCSTLLETERLLTDEGVAKVSSGQLPVGTVILSSRAPIGYLAVTEVPVSINQGIIAMICNGELPNYYVLNWTRENMDNIVAKANGSTFLEISKQNFRPIPAIVPPVEILNSFMDIVSPIYQQIVILLKQSRTLSALRDALLPKLLSGKVKV